MSFIDRHKEGPFFLYLSYNAVHSPMQAAQKYVDRFKGIEDEHRRVFAGMLSAMDDGIGRVLDKLRDEKLEEDTLVFFISDNGGPTKELTSSNGPLRGGKGKLHEGGIRIPFLVQWKGTLPAGQVYAEPVISLDVFPTALAAAEVKKPAKLKFDGVNLLPFVKGDDDGWPHETLYWRYGTNFALRHKNWKLVRQSKGYMGVADAELYDLSKDLAEEKNLAKDNPVTLGQLYAAWKRIDVGMAEPRW